EGGKGGRKSERLIVPLTPGNPPHGDSAEGRGRLVNEPLEGHMARTPSRGFMSTGQQRIAELAEQSPPMAFTNLAHHLTLGWLLHAYHATRPDGAPGVDGQTGADYGKDLLANLQGLLDRA